MQTYKKISRGAIILAVVVSALSIKIAHANAPVMTGSAIYTAHLYEWVSRLSKAESNDDPDLVYLDVNRRYSYSCLQFQKATWDAQSRKYGISGSIMDCDKQEELAVAMISDHYSAWRNWYVSSTRKIGLPPRT